MLDIDKIIKLILALLAPIAFFGLIYALWFTNIEIADNLRELSSVIVGTLIVIVKDVYGFFFGSSQGSKDKDVLLRKEVN